MNNTKLMEIELKLQSLLETLYPVMLLQFGLRRPEFIKDLNLKSVDGGQTVFIDNTKNGFALMTRLTTPQIIMNESCCLPVTAIRMADAVEELAEMWAKGASDFNATYATYPMVSVKQSDDFIHITVVGYVCKGE